MGIDMGIRGLEFGSGVTSFPGLVLESSDQLKVCFALIILECLVK